MLFEVANKPAADILNYEFKLVDYWNLFYRLKSSSSVPLKDLMVFNHQSMDHHHHVHHIHHHHQLKQQQQHQYYEQHQRVPQNQEHVRTFASF